MMQVTVELSLYPLAQEQFRETIKTFIAQLEEHPALTVVRNRLSTQVSGSYAEVFSVLAREMEQVHQQLGQAVFVAKILKGDLLSD